MSEVGFLKEALFIGVALGSDLPRYNAETGNVDMPGAKAARWWLRICLQLSPALRPMAPREARATTGPRKRWRWFWLMAVPSWSPPTRRSGSDDPCYLFPRQVCA
jgi:hypothetical protein